MNGRLRSPGQSATVVATARNTVSCFLVSPLPVQTLRELVRRAQAGLRVDVIIPDRYGEKVALTERYRKNFSAAGGRLFMVPLGQRDWRRSGLLPRNLLVVDGQNAWRADADGWCPIAAEEVTGKLLSQLTNLRRLGAVYSNKKADRKLPFPVYFSAAKTRVQPGENVRLSWSAAGAESVEILPGRGQLPRVGDRLVRVDVPTEFTLIAWRNGESVSKVLSIDVDQKLHLSYRLLAGDPFGEKHPEPLRERPDLPGFFGAAADVPLSLIWETRNAVEVWLDQKAVAKNGEIILHPTGRTSLQLRARGVTGDELTERIVVNVFSLREAPASLPEAPTTTLITPGSPTFEPAKNPLRAVSNLSDKHPKEPVTDSGRSIFSGVRSWLKKIKP